MTYDELGLVTSANSEDSCEIVLMHCLIRVFTARPYVINDSHTRLVFKAMFLNAPVCLHTNSDYFQISLIVDDYYMEDVNAFYKR